MSKLIAVVLAAATLAGCAMEPMTAEESYRFQMGLLGASNAFNTQQMMYNQPRRPMVTCFTHGPHTMCH